MKESIRTASPDRTILVPFNPKWVGPTGLLTEFWDHLPDHHESGDRFVGSYEVLTKVGPDEVKTLLTFEADKLSRSIEQQLPGRYTAHVGESIARVCDFAGEVRIIYELLMPLSDDGTLGESRWEFVKYDTTETPTDRFDRLPPNLMYALQAMARNATAIVWSMRLTEEFISAQGQLQPDAITLGSVAADQIQQAEKMALAMSKASSPFRLLISGAEGATANQLPVHLLKAHRSLTKQFQSSALPKNLTDKYLVSAAHYRASEVAAHYRGLSHGDRRAIKQPKDELGYLFVKRYASDIAILAQVIEDLHRLFMPIVKDLTTDPSLDR